jgi:hypothetical protein
MGVYTGQIMRRKAKGIKLLAPNQELFLALYLDPKSETFGNAYQSGLKVGFSEGYSHRISQRDWVTQNVSRATMSMKAERNLDKALDINVTDEKIGDRAIKVSMFVLEKLNKEIYGEAANLVDNSVKILVMPSNLLKKNDITISNADALPGNSSVRPAQVPGSASGTEVRKDSPSVP